MSGARGLPQRRILDTRFGQGQAFVAAWQAWKDDPQGPRILHYVAIAEQAPHGQELPQPHAWYGLLPGVHRLVFEGGHVLLTLCIGDTERMLRQLDFHADAVLLHGDAPIHLKALARCCRRGTGIEVRDPAAGMRQALEGHGFVLQETDDAALRGEFAPAWQPRGPRPAPAAVAGRCIVVGAGLAGAAAAASMARRGWSVQVLEAGPAPACGASGLPAGVLVPHSSPDDNLLSRLSRDGARATLQQAQALLVAGQDFELSGVLEHRLDGPPSQPPPSPAAAVWNRPADPGQKRLAALDAQAAADWHQQAAWIRPARLVQAWLAQPGIALQCGAGVGRLRRDASGWTALAADGRVLAAGEVVIVAAAVGSALLVDGLTLQPVRGQVTWALHDGPLALPPFPVNGDGSFIPAVPTQAGPAWVCGASFERGATDLQPREADQQENIDRLRRLLPSVSAQMEPASRPLQAWVGIRCASNDRRPLVGPVGEGGHDGLWLSTAMGSRGLTFAALAGELIAARIHGEPLPLARNLARALSPDRRKNRPGTRASAGE
ncbi:FAD-dependent 5-carboxymethylaminomethyl-2-thiouridine(34) oxidoreductase MnmC [Caenimonas terrae]|uniref:FAD-dependent 5-carboxymethylaminomethyl-2-thiouridine(34) oxidoreductase MnmC n=1 Tax=Caenimonas terrae TaxID=696074 RepID=A0ABW0NBJ6_9BURK